MSAHLVLCIALPDDAPRHHNYPVTHPPSGISMHLGAGMRNNILYWQYNAIVLQYVIDNTIYWYANQYQYIVLIQRTIPIYCRGICYITLLFPFITITSNDLQYNNVLLYYYTHFTILITILPFYFAHHYNITSYFVHFFYITLSATAILPFHALSRTPSCISWRNDPLSCHLRCFSFHGLYSNLLSTHLSCTCPCVV